MMMAVGEGKRYELSVDAFVKIFNHGLKHPTNFVFGALLGKTKDSGVVQVWHAVPIFHSIPLLPLTEIALEKVTMCRSKYWYGRSVYSNDSEFEEHEM